MLRDPMFRMTVVGAVCCVAIALMFVWARRIDKRAAEERARDVAALKAKLARGNRSAVGERLRAGRYGYEYEPYNFEPRPALRNVTVDDGEVVTERRSA